MLPTFHILSHSTVLNSLESVIGTSNDLYNLVVQFKNIPYIKDIDESDFQIKGLSLPPVSLLFGILLNLCLYELDNEMSYKHPSIGYIRNLNEVFLSNCPSLTKEDIETLLDKLNLKADITCIKPGEDTIQCNVGNISIDKNGKRIYNRDE